MGIFNNEIIMNDEDPFKEDKLERENEADKLTELFKVVENQMVLAINSPWGTGKTTFLNMWKRKLQIEGYSTIFFNCWENDFIEEPFIAFIEEIRNELGNELIDKDFIEKSKNVGSFLIKQIPNITKYMIKKKTDIDLDEFISESDFKDIILEQMKDYKESKNSVQLFKKELEKKANKNLENTGKPLVIFIDEIDRCRPNFAIKLLERIKHFFCIPNIIFILGMDKRALSNSIRVIYGNETEVEGYLSRFIDLEYKLSENSKEKIINYLLEKYKFLDVFGKRRISDCYENDFNELKKILIGCIKITNLALRDIEKVLVRLLFIVNKNTERYIFIYPLILLLCIRQVDVDLYNKMKNNKLSIKDLKKRLMETRNNDAIIKNEHTENLMNAFIAMISDDKEYIDNITQLKDDKKIRSYEWVRKRVTEWAEWSDTKLSYEKVCGIIEMYDGIEF